MSSPNLSMIMTRLCDYILKFTRNLHVCSTGLLFAEYPCCLLDRDKIYGFVCILPTDYVPISVHI